MSKETVLAAMVFFPFAAGLLAYAAGRFCRRTGAGRGREAGQKTGQKNLRDGLVIGASVAEFAMTAVMALQLPAFPGMLSRCSAASFHEIISVCEAG